MSIGCPFYIEVERRTSAPIVTDKIQRYCGHYLRLLESHGRCVIRPILVVHHDVRPAKKRRPGSGAERLRDNLSTLLYADSEGHFAGLNEVLRMFDEYAEIGRLIAVCGWEEVNGRGVYEPCYYPLAEHAEGDDGVEDKGKRVTLYALAREREALLAAFRERKVA